MNRRDLLKTATVTGATLGLSAKAFAKKPKYKIKMATTWIKNFPGFGTGANNLGKMIETLSGGDIQVKVYGAGEIVPAMGVFDAVQQGTVELGHSAAYYWQGKVPASPFFASVPFGFTASEMNAWIQYGGGQKLWDKAYKPFGIKPFSVGNTGVQMGGWFNREIKTVADFKGLKIRMPGLGGKVLSELGAAVVTMSGGEVFQSLKSGTLDAAEWVCPFNDRASGLHKAAKFYYWPGWHEPGSNLELLVNQEFYQSLSKRLQEVLRIASQAANFSMVTEYTARNAPALKTILSSPSVQLKRFPDPVLKSLYTTSQKVVKAVSKKNALAGEVFQSMESFRGEVMSWQKISEIGYMNAREL